MRPVDRILLGSDARLRRVSAEVSVAEAQLDPLMEEMFEALHDFRKQFGWGRAISAPQLGYAYRVIAMNLGSGDVALINPRPTWASSSTLEVWDDCMSFPDIAVPVRRHERITVAYRTLGGRAEAFENAPSDLSELLQHELDHLDGILMTDRLVAGGRTVMRSAIKGALER